MKIIHTADIHLDSPLVGVKDCKLRRQELFDALATLVDSATSLDAQAIIIAGDLFDCSPSTATISQVAQLINSNDQLAWFILQGNHGSNAPYSQLQQLCNNAHFFGQEWSYYQYGNVVICGRELGTNDSYYYRQLQLNKDNYNIVLLHGDIDNDDYGLIDKNALANANANYVALGHRHGYSSSKLGNTTLCYSGVLECRGFDETSQTGFVLIDTDSKTTKFCPQSIRKVVTYNVDVTGIQNNFALKQQLQQVFSNASVNDYANVIFAGQLDSGVDLQIVCQEFEKNFFAFRYQDDTTVALNLQQLMDEVSLRGEFVRTVTQNVADEQKQREIIKLGLNALQGELK